MRKMQQGMRFSMNMVGAVALLAVLSLTARTAFAHAVLVQSTPGAHQAVKGPDVAIDLKFNSRVDGSRSALTFPEGWTPHRCAFSPRTPAPNW